MKAELNESVAYHDQLAEEWSGFYSNPGFRRRMELFEEILTKYVKSDQRWLDAGCGSGVLSKLLVDKGAKVLGIDASVRMLKAAEGQLSASSDGSKIRFQHIRTVEDLA